MMMMMIKKTTGATVFLVHVLLLSSQHRAVANNANPLFVGYYSWNWSTGSEGPSGDANGVAFTGLVDVDGAIKGYSPGASWCCPPLRGKQMISLGGGNAAGTFTVTVLASIEKSLSSVAAANYTGVVFDVEQVSGPASALSPAFASVFAACKKMGLTVAITTSHSAPYMCDSSADAVALVKGWVSDPNVDILSPQLYSSGSEATPQFAVTASCAPDCGWNLYSGFKGIFAPSIVETSHFPAVKAFFGNASLPNADGYFQWKQVV